MPPLGFPEAMKVEFVHSCPENCKCRPTASTCQLSINIPVHANTGEMMRELMTSFRLRDMDSEKYENNASQSCFIQKEMFLKIFSHTL